MDNLYVITLLITVVSYWQYFGVDAESCVDTVNAEQEGTDWLGSSLYVVVPRSNFSCIGRITGYMVSLDRDDDEDCNNPRILIWRPSNTEQTAYSIINTYTLRDGDIDRMGSYRYANVTFTGNDRIEFQSGDVIGYQHRSSPCYRVWSIRTEGYTAYSSFFNSINTDGTSFFVTANSNRQPLIQVIFDIRCDNLSIPADGVLSCSSGTEGVGYEGDTCSVTCNTGYELTGSDTRTCESDGSWSDTNAVCRRVPCTPLINPNNGVSNCSLGDDGVPSYEDTCNFTCDTGYELTGSSERTCQSNGSWCGSLVSCIIMECPSSSLPMNSMLSEFCNSTYQSMCELQCQEGFNGTGDPSYVCDVTSNGSVAWMIEGAAWRCERVNCSFLIAPNNGVINCSLGDDGVHSYEDTCSFTCNTGYELTGSDTRTCQSDRSWSGSNAVCNRVSCFSLTDPNNGSIDCSLGDDGVPSYEDTCNYTCDTGYELTGSETRTCQSDGSWSGSDDVCGRVSCPSLIDPNNGMINCSLGDDGVPSYEDTCSFTCNSGYELTGSDTRTCQSNGSWSGSDDVCRRVQCPSLDDPNNGVINCSLGDDGVPSYEDTCSFTCNTGYELTSSDTRTCQSNGNWSGSDDVCGRVSCTSLTDPNNGVINCSLGDDGVPSYEDTCSFTCNTGYELTGSDTRTCQSDGSWNGGDDACRRVQCHQLINGNLDCVNGSTGVFEDTCTFSCNAGYELQGSNNGTCLANQSWSGGDPICVALNCSTSPPLNNSQQQSSCDTQYQSTCTVTCNEGYTRNNVISVTYLCNITMEPDVVEWVTLDGTSCQRNNCSQLMNPINGTISCSLQYFPMILYKDTCSFTCNTGYKLTGSDTRTCQSNGSWSGSDVLCMRSAAINENNDSNPGAIAGGVLAGIAVFSLVCLLVVLYLYKRHRKRSYVVKQDDLQTWYSNDLAYENTNATIQMENQFYSETKNEPTAPNYDYIEDSVMEFSSTTRYSVKSHKSFQGIDIYNIPEGQTMKFINHSSNKSDAANPYEIPIESTYEDPGINKEKIYEWFEKKKYRKLKTSDIKIDHQIGSGEFGTVSLAQWLDNSNESRIVAVKSLNFECSESERVKFLREAAIMGQFLHNNVVRLHGVVTEGENMMIVLEYMPKGDLHEILLKMQKKKDELKDDRLPLILQKYCRQIAAGMNYLANKQFVHRDLAARNILVSSDDVCKIADFGMARDVADDNFYISSGGKVPAKWTAPEALLYQKYSVSSDIWSYGCVLYEIWSLGHKPFEGKSTNETIELLNNGYRLPPPPGCPRKVYQIMIDCWHRDPEKRPEYPAIITDLTGTSSLTWSDEDIRIAGERATVLGNPLIDGSTLFYDLQLIYKD